MDTLLLLETQFMQDRDTAKTEMMKFNKDSQEYWFQYGAFLQACSSLFDIREKLLHGHNHKVDFQA